MVFMSSVLIFLSIWAFAVFLLFSLFYKEKPIERLKYFDDDYDIKEKLENEKKNKISVLKVLAALIPSSRLSKKKNQKIAFELIKADIPVTPEELSVIKILSSTIICLLIYMLLKEYIIALISLIIIWNTPRLMIARKKKQRIKQFNEQLSEGIMVISNSLKAGYSFLQAIAVVVEETKDPFSKEFRKLLKEMSFGILEEEALKNFMARMESDDLKLMVNAILIQKDIGGNLSEILDNISETIRERQKIQGELKTLTAQGKLSGIIVMAIPFFLASIIYLFNKSYIILLFTTPIGIAMVSAALFNQLIGLIMIRKIISIDI